MLPGPTHELLVDAGPHDRAHGIVTFPVPSRGRPVALRGTGGHLVPVQIDERGQGAFVLRALPAGGRLRLTMVTARAPGSACARLETRRPVTPGKPYRARYRFVIADGAPDRALLERLERLCVSGGGHHQEAIIHECVDSSRPLRAHWPW